MLTYSFVDRGEEPLYEYLYKKIKKDIMSGVIAPGEKLPSKRSFSQHLGVSLITVEGAYTQLVAEGYVVSYERKGYYVNDIPVLQNNNSLHKGQHKRNEPIAKKASHNFLAEKNKASPKGNSFSDSFSVDLTGQEVARGMFPYGAWSKSIRDVLICETEQDLIGNCDAAGLPRLREVIANHLFSYRGMEVDPECIVVGAGSQLLDNMIIQTIGREYCYGIEDPGYQRLSKLYQANGVPLSYVPLDEKGVNIEALHKSGVSVMHIMPSHQFPTGLVTPISRRYELLAWASEEPYRFLIEDDFDSEFRMTGKPIPSLKSIDTQDCVIYTNTFSKTLGPAFRLGYMVLPYRLKEVFDSRLSFYSCTVSAVDQFALARFIEQGDYERHLNRMKKYYRLVRDELITAITKSSFADRVSFQGQDSGLYFILSISTEKQEEEIACDLRKRGLRILSLSSFSFNLRGKRKETLPSQAKFLISYSGLSIDAIPWTISVMEECF